MDTTTEKVNTRFEFQSIEEIDLNDNLTGFEKIKEEFSSDYQSNDSTNQRQSENFDPTIAPHVGMGFPN